MKNELTKSREKINKIDRKAAKLFVKRLKAVEEIAKYKKERGMEIFDKKREEDVLNRNAKMIKEAVYRDCYVDLLKKTMDISKEYQSQLFDCKEEGVNVLRVKNGYPVFIGRGLLDKADKYFDLSKKALIVTDDCVPHKYVETVEKLCKNAITLTLKSGEASKSFSTLEEVLRVMQDNKFDRQDCIIAVGGGAVGDLAGFASSIYMRGIDFYNCPTTLLSQLDSSIGGKTAINFGGVKNSIGSFKQPKSVIIDPDTLATLPERQMASGLAEAIKVALTSDGSLFEKFETLSKEEIYANIEEIIIRSLMIKKSVVEKDEKECGLRKMLNFGHTLGHGIEASEGMHGLTHGECVALGMIPVCSETTRGRLIEVLKKTGLPYEYHGDLKEAVSYVIHDKKAASGSISVILVEKPGEYIMQDMSFEDFSKLVLN